MSLRACAKCTDSGFFRASAKSHMGICFPLIHSTAPDDSVSGQWKRWSDCVCAQAELGLRYPHVPEDTFSHDVNLYCLQTCKKKQLCLRMNTVSPVYYKFIFELHAHVHMYITFVVRKNCYYQEMNAFYMFFVCVQFCRLSKLATSQLMFRVVCSNLSRGTSFHIKLHVRSPKTRIRLRIRVVL